MRIHQVVNTLISSNAYVITFEGPEAVVVDPGDPNINPIVEYLAAQQKQVRYVFLTHAHLDHIAGVLPLYQYCPFELITSHKCAEHIADQKKNFSLYSDRMEAFEIRTIAPTIVEDQATLELAGHRFRFLYTPGHSEGDLCIFLDDEIVFTGDVLLATPTPLNLPGSNKASYAASRQKLVAGIDHDTMIYPGHGAPFFFRTIDFESMP